MEAHSAGASIAAGGRAVEPSVANALPHFAPLLLFPLVVCAAMFGGWWIAGPFAFFMLASPFDRLLGLEERNMDPATTRESQLFLYNLSLWVWGAFWPAIFVFALWQMLVGGRLSLWEVALIAGILVMVAQTVFVVGHELVHRRAPWERRLGEFLLASVSYPHYATEHVYIHHPRVCTPLDPGSAPKGVSFWEYLPREVLSNIVGAWRFERRRLTRRQLPPWHHTNAFWRYAVLVSHNHADSRVICTTGSRGSGDEMLAQVVEKSAVDADFREQLLADPKAAISSELGITIPDSMNIRVHESDMQTVHLALPPDSNITEEQMEAISAGLCCCW